MAYVLSLEERLHFARVQRERYERDPEFRLSQINRARSRRGMPPVRSLDEIRPRGRFA
jgi:hypothetical protein